MYSNLSKRLAALESHATVVQRRTLSGLVALCESGKLSLTEMTDEELEMIISAGLPGDVDVRQLSDAELEAIINGGTK